MNTDIFWRLVWKEYRQQRALWTAIAVGGLIFQMAVLIIGTLNGARDVTNALFTVALSVPILYSLGCGAVLFAGEHEAETFPFQQALPVSAGRVFFAKLVFALVSALLLFPVLWLLAFAIASWRLPDATWHLRLWGGGVVATIEVMIWAVLGSLVLRRVLPAAIVSGVIAVAFGYTSLAMVEAYGRYFRYDVDEYFATLPMRTAAALIALAIATKLGRQWFHEVPIRWSFHSKPRAGSHVIAQPQARPATGLTVWARLVWHAWRQGRTTLLCCVLGYFALSTWLAFDNSDSQAYCGMLPVLAAILGASAFAADQRQGNYQFFTERGVSARSVWWSRQFVWGLALAIVVVPVASARFLWGPLPDLERYFITLFVLFATLAFAVSQLCSILIRSAIIAVLTAAMCSWMLCVWVGFAATVGVPWWLAGLPLPFTLFWASWLYAPKWIQQRHTWRVRLVTVATIVVPLCGVVVATAAYRVYEIPAVKLSFDPAVPKPDDSPAARETAAMYLKAQQILRPLASDLPTEKMIISTRDDQWQAGIELFLAASRRDRCYFKRWDDAGTGGLFDAQFLVRAIAAEAEARVDTDDLEGAAELHQGLLRLASHFYQQNHDAWGRAYGAFVERSVYMTLPKWADHASVTLAQIEELRLQLEIWSQHNVPDWERSVIEEWRYMQQCVALDDQALEHLGTGMPRVVKIFGTLLPWERWRISRLADVYTESQLQGIRALNARDPQVLWADRQAMPWDVQLTLKNGKRILIRSSDVETWQSTTRWLELAMGVTASSYDATDRSYRAERAAVQQQLALIAWRKEHGELPESLDQLIGHSFQSLPTDPYTGRPFVYVRRGVRSAPFLWSPGWEVRYVPRSSRSASASPVADDFRSKDGISLTDADLQEVGVRYPLSGMETVEESPPLDADGTAAPTDLE